MWFDLIFVAIICYIKLVTCFYIESEAMKPCPDVKPQKNIDVDKLLGTWHLSLLVLDSAHEDFVETEMCVTGEISRLNSTLIRQIWTVQSEDIFNEPSAVLEFPTTVDKSGVWKVHTPLGGELKATVFDSHPTSHIIVTHCGLHMGRLVHLWTAAVTRSRTLSPILRLRMTSALIENGYDPVVSKVITWHKC
ncbi:hypothetical protein LSTR_LSTR005957 [Laodelphax striatellus]|uniref:Lipocalin/cytosolic fatty-acid binding domain-containing protein n=1 Tax=Laodelphax striatellus TaxID=195883 RepID=A0A482WEX1_LAOST|nr:hypothetical protein LSTR_LSTR005957 [Laodelphax striatellus]